MKSIINNPKHRDSLFYGVLALVFLFILYYIFYLDGSKKNDDTTKGLNTELPDGKQPPLLDKMNAYENAHVEDIKEKRLRSLNDYVFNLKSSGGRDGEFDVTLQNENDSRVQGVELLQNQLQVFDKNDEDFNRIAMEKANTDLENHKLRQELEALKRKGNQEDRLLMMEKSLEIANRYNGTQTSGGGVTELEKRDIVEVSTVSKEVVTSLSEDNLYLDKPYNHGFITAVGSGYESVRNTIKACIYEHQVIISGQFAKVKLLEPLLAGNIIIPRNHIISGIADVKTNRTEITITSIQYAGNVIPVSLKVYDQDGMSGVNTPGSTELNATKEAVANISSGMGSSLNITRSAGAAIATDAARGVINSGTQYLSKKIRQNEATLKANYPVLLITKK